VTGVMDSDAADVLAGRPPVDPDSPEEDYLGGEFAGRDCDAR
jgi:hypothetical protein